MSRIKEYLRSNWQVSTLVFASHIMLFVVIGLLLTLIFSLIYELDSNTKKIFELEKQIIGLKLSRPADTISTYKSFQWEEEPIQDLR